MTNPKELLQQRLDEIEEVLKTVTKGHRGDMYLNMKALRDLYAVTITHITLISDDKLSHYNYQRGKDSLARELEAKVWLNKQKIRKKSALTKREAKKRINVHIDKR